VIRLTISGHKIQMTIDTRGPARRRETVRDKNAKRKVNGKGSNRTSEERRTMRVSRRTKKNDGGGGGGGGGTESRNADRRSEL